MAVIQSLIVDFRANTAQFLAGADQVAGKAKSIKSYLTGMFDNKGGADMVAKLWAAKEAIAGGARAVTEGMKQWQKTHNWVDATRATVEAMPMGIGDVAKLVNELKMQWSGVAAEIEKANKEIAQQERESNKNLAKAVELRSIADNNKKLQEDLGGMGLSGGAKDSYQADLEAARAKAALLDKAKADQKKGGYDLSLITESAEYKNQLALIDQIAAKKKQVAIAAIKDSGTNQYSNLYGDTSLQDQIDQMKALGASVAEIDKYVSEMQDNAAFKRQSEDAAKVADIMKQIRGEYDKSTMSAEDLLKKQLESLNASQAQIDVAMKLTQESRAAEEEKKNQEDQKKKAEDMQKEIKQLEVEQSPATQLKEQLRKLEEMKNAGLSGSAYDSAKQKAFDTFASATMGGSGISKGQTLSSGMSLEYYRDSGKESQESLLKQMLEELRKSNHGKKIGAMDSPWQS